jgi:chromosome segregation ATPase
MADKDDEQKQREAEETKKADERIAEIANRAAADHAKRLTAKFEKELKDRDERIATLMAEREPKKDPQQPATPPAGATPAEARLRELEARIAERDRKLDEADKERKAVELQRQADEERNATVQALADAGVTGKAQKGALAVLMADKRIGRDEAGRVCFLVPKEGYVEKTPVDDGIKDWVNSEEGQLYLPAKGIQGSGTKPSAARTGGKAPTRSETISDAKKALTDMFRGMSGQ